jgi:bifunctional non-homologous end joining protein LigD
MPKSKAEDNAEVAGVRLTHAHKVYYPDNGVTKLELAKYYQRIEEWMMPELRDRPLSLVRMPGGITGEKFFQKHPTDNFPDYIDRIRIKEKKGTTEYIWVDELNDIMYLVNLGVLELHTWGSTIPKVDYPDRVVFDLDPDPIAPWDYVIEGAKLIRQILSELKLESFVKTSGGKGLHIVLPLKNEVHKWDTIKDFSLLIAENLVKHQPDKYTVELRKDERVGKVFVDYLRNSKGATTIAAFSTRARPGAAVSVPVFWEEVTTKLQPNQYNIHNIFQRLAKLQENPWQEIDRVDQNLPI